MDSKKTFILLMSICAILIIGTAGLMYKSAGLLKSEGNKLLSLKLEKEVLGDKQNALVQAKKDIVTYDALEKIAKTIVPQEKDQARTVREISDIANEVNAPITSIEFPKTAVAKTKANTSTTVDDKYQLTPVKGISGLYEMEISIICQMPEPIATYEQISGLIKGLEHNRRTANITKVSIQPDKDNHKVANFSIIVKVYIKP